jgi:thioesterase domain-containing protein
MTDQPIANLDFAISPVDHDPFGASTAIVLPATSEQRALFAASHHTPDSAHNRGFAVWLDGELDATALYRALSDLPIFHEALRGAFDDHGSTIILAAEMPVPVAQHDLVGRSQEARAAEVERLIALAGSAPFDLRRGPMFRATVVRLEPRRHLVLLCVHEAICDGWSLDVVLADLGRLYSAYAGSGPLPVPPRHGAADHAATAESAEARARARAVLPYWVRLLSEPPAPRPAAIDDAAGSRAAVHAAHALAGETVKLLRQFARTNSLSAFAVLYSAYVLGLARAVRQSDLLVGFPVAGHPDLGMEDSVGHLARLVVTRHILDARQAFVAVARATFGGILDARENAHAGLSDIAAELAKRAPGAPPPRLAGSFSHIQKYAAGKLSFGECRVDYAPLPRAHERQPVHIDAFDAHDVIVLHAHAQEQHFSKAGLANLLGEIETILRQACDVPVVPAPTTSDPSAAAAGDRPGAGESAAACHPPSVPPEDSQLSEEPIVVTLQDGEAGRPPLLCILGIEIYVNLAQAITDGTPVIGLHCPAYYVPGVTPRPSLGQVARRYAEVIRQRFPTGPYKLLGLCFGGVVAFETARLLREAGAEVELVVVLDIALPTGKRVNWPKRAKLLAREGLASPKQSLKRLTDVVIDPIAERLLSSAQSRAYLEKFGFVAPKAEPVDLPVLGEPAKDDVAAFASKPDRLDTHLVVFHALKNGIPEWVEVASDMGWGGKAKTVETYRIDCEHLRIVRPPHSHEVAAIIMQDRTGARG